MAPTRSFFCRNLKLLILLRKRQRIVRRYWVREVLRTRKISGEYTTLVQQMREVDPQGFQTYFRMSPDVFDEVLGKLRARLTKETTNFREPIPPEERLAVTLRYVKKGAICMSLGNSYYCIDS